MNNICKRLKEYKPSIFVRTDNIPLDTDISCHEDIKQTFTSLTNSSLYEWNGNKITFYYTNEHCDTLFQQVDRLLQLLQPNNYPLVATILLSPSKKYYPKEKIFGPLHVNTGYASEDRIVVYRKEEWFKVFIHECFHYFHFDRLLFDDSYSKRILNFFKIDSEVNVYECYCEIWARMLNCCIISVVANLSLDRLLYHEKKYARRHMVNVLHHMGLTYKQLKTDCDFKEDTNVFAYVILGALLLNKHYLEKNLEFKITEPEKFIQFIEDNHNDEEFLDSIQHIQPMQTTTMSFYNIDDYIPI